MNNTGILDKKTIDRIDKLKAQIDQSKLEIFVESIFTKISEQVIANAPIQDIDNRERGAEVIKNFRAAWNYARSNTPPAFSQAHLEEVAGRVEPALRVPNQSYAAIRDSSANTGYTCMPPTDRNRVISHLNKVSKSLETGLHPVEEALFLYFHLIRIQPFSNANKRTANIIMNTGLLRDGFAPISIPLHEEELFKQYFEGALLGFEDDSANHAPGSSVPYLNPRITQRQFYDYLSDKEENNLRRVTDRLKGVNQYRITIETKNPGVIYSLKKQISGWFHRDKKNRPFKQSLSKKREIELIGEIPYFTLDTILHSNKNKGINSYKIIVDGKR